MVRPYSRMPLTATSNTRHAPCTMQSAHRRRRWGHRRRRWGPQRRVARPVAWSHSAYSGVLKPHCDDRPNPDRYSGHSIRRTASAALQPIDCSRGQLRVELSAAARCTAHIALHVACCLLLVVNACVRYLDWLAFVRYAALKLSAQKVLPSSDACHCMRNKQTNKHSAAVTVDHSLRQTLCSDNSCEA
jgi:hypothetical protein